MDTKTGQISENVELENLHEEEADDFKNEWRQRLAQTSTIRDPHYPHHRHQTASNRLQNNASRFESSPVALEHDSSSRSSKQQNKSSSRNYNNTSHRPQYRYSDTIDLTNDTPVDDDIQEIQQLPSRQSSSTKPKPSTKLANDAHIQRSYH